MLALLGGFERDPTVRLGVAGLGECGAQRVDELFADHNGGRGGAARACIVLADLGLTPGT